MDQRRTGPDRNSSINPVCLYGEFTALGNLKVRYAVCLTESELVVQRITSAPAWRKKLVLSLKDCVGCRAYREDDNTDPAAYMAAYFYPLKRRWTGSGVTTQKGEQCFRLAGLQDPRANLEEAEKWARAVRERAARQHVREGASVSVLSRPCRIMLLLNPQSGKGQALALYNNYIKRMLGEAGIQHSLVITERQNHARELVKVSDLSQWDALVIMSGDGLLFEVINGLLERPDWEEAIRTPLGILPGGSGNGLAASVHHYSRTVPVSSEDLLVSCGFLLCKGLVSRMDLASIQLSSGLRLFSCLSLAWGFVADVDIESEKYRHVGAARFTVGTLVRLVSLRIYKGKLAYLPATEDHNQDLNQDINQDHNQDLNQDHDQDLNQDHNQDINQDHDLNQDINQDHDQDLNQDLNQDHNQDLNQDHNQDINQDHNQDHTDEGLTDDPTLHCKDETSAPSLDSDPCRPSAGSPGQNTFHNSCQSNNAIKARWTESRASESTSRTLAGPSDTLLPPLDQPLPSSWVVVQEEDFVLMLAVYQSHLAEDLMAAPGATLNDGVIHLFYVRAGIKRTALLNLFLAMEKGVHLSAGCQHLVHTKVRALRLVPYSPKGIITVDGEAVDYGPVQAEVHRGMARFICG